MTQTNDQQVALLRAAFARLNAVAFGTAAGSVGALTLMVATAMLTIQGAPDGVTVGSHLNLLSHFLPGYSVSGIGAVVGGAYGFLLGFIGGGLTAVFWNLTRVFYLFIVTLRPMSRWLEN